MSLFGGRRKNRAFQRRHVLDVKLSSDQKRGAQAKWLGLVLGAAVSAFLVLFVAWKGGSWLVQKMIYQNPAFAVREIQVETDGVIAPEQIRRWAGVRPEDNLFALDLERVQRDLESVHVVRSAEVERILPHALRILIREREPVAQFIFAQPRLGASTDLVSYALDEEGFVMPHIMAYQRSVPQPVSDPLTIVTGVAPTEVRPGKKVEAPQVLAALRFLNAFDRSPMAGFTDIREIHVGLPDILVVSTEQRAQVVFGLRQPEAQLERWRSIHDHGVRAGLKLASADLSVGNNIPARWLEPSEAALVKPKAQRPHRGARKRNA
ncbi:MAG: FtsQ-type POTRA domain-containing protein [Verrucomicrobia bacterium]|nr:FtsQ-type POTRA domain-containing protein [Verrucomicrobiota bacterium]